MQQASLYPPPIRDTAVRVGPAGWQYKDWEGKVYPQGKGRAFDPLAFLADYVDTIEINSSFYRPPRPVDAAGWAGRIRNNPRFKFTAKAWQRLTHGLRESTAASVARDSEQVRRSMAPLAEARVLGALLLQFPWSFRMNQTHMDHVATVLREFREFPVVVEVRHGGWDCEEFYRFLQDCGAGFCNVDQPVIGDSLRPGARVTSGLGYLRLHGRNYDTWFKEKAGRDARYDYLYSKAEIGQITRLVRTIQQSAEETYVITNNHFQGKALANAFDILEELDARPPAIPPLLAAAYPDRFRAAGN